MAIYKNKIIGVAIFVVCFLVAIFGSFFFYQKAYADKIYRNVYVANIDLSGLSKKQAQYVVDKYYRQILDREITIKAGEKQIKTKLADTGVAFDVNQIIDKSYSVGRGGTIYNSAINSVQTLWQKKKIVATPKIDKQKYDAFMNLIVPQLNTDAADATLKIEKGSIVESKEVIGQHVTADDITRELVNMTNNPQSATLTLQSQTVNPQAQSQDFGVARSFAQDILNKKITLTYESFAFTPTQEELGNWVAFTNDNGKLTGSLDDSRIKTYLNKIASNFEVQKVDQKINSLDNSVIVQGQAGKLLDKDKALSDIKQAMQNQVSTLALVTNQVDPEVIKVIPSEGFVPGRFPGKYIDVDLTQQKLCTIDGNTIVKCYVVSSGKSSTPTPVGTRVIDSKEARRWSSQFGLWMPWWMSMGGGYGLHELPEWPSGYKEGEAHLGTPVSHGCVRLGIGSAEEVYNWTDAGTPVYIHK